MLPSLTLEDFETTFADRHLIHGVVEKWAREKPFEVALIDADRDKRTDWATFDRIATAVSQSLHRAGFQKGERFATVLPLTSELLFIEYACFKIGVIFAPLDMRLGPTELMRSLQAVEAKGIAFMKCPAIPEPSTFVKSLESRPQKLLLQFAPVQECAEGATPVSIFIENVLSANIPIADKASSPEGSEQDGALVIFTTGSTGSPKPALLSHRNVSCQAMCISRLLCGDQPLITLVNLPPSHVGCQAELLMGTLFEGGTAVLLPIFDPLQSMRAIEKFRVSAIGQIPAMFQFEWRLKDYDSFDLKTLDFAAYGGQQVPLEFIDKMAQMAPFVGSGLGLTETAGFCTYIRQSRNDARNCVTTLGYDMPVYPMTIRAAMREDGSAGEELVAGALGHVCFRGPQTFLGYLNDPAATAATISKEGYLYTGDLGYRDDHGLHLAGRAKLVIKPAGYQVFPGDVERHFSSLPGVASCAVVGVEHPVISEAIVAFVEAKAGVALSPTVLERHARELATYMRPRHYVVLGPGELPLNRVAKADYMALRERALSEVEGLRAKGLWR